MSSSALNFAASSLSCIGHASRQDLKDSSLMVFLNLPVCSHRLVRNLHKKPYHLSPSQFCSKSVHFYDIERTVLLQRAKQALMVEAASQSLGFWCCFVLLVHSRDSCGKTSINCKCHCWLNRQKEQERVRGSQALPSLLLFLLMSLLLSRHQTVRPNQDDSEIVLN